ncbi:uncharacterized protein LOC114368235 [Glycine soja]|uniref:uncharacterized protein LOC114368235 n=1 Tax=Glycine soja TaxID=3848 RepID=UPI001039D603|nr:uncharacterized protein LOC114368235 [Glycine soja]
MHLHLFKAMRDGIATGMVPFHFNIVGVSDPISMGTCGMCYSLPSKDLIANNIETVMATQWYDNNISIPNFMSHKENLLCELNTEKGTWKIVVRITDIWRLNKHNGRQSIEMVLMDHTGTKIGATLWQELFPEFEPKLHCGGAYVIQNVKVVDTHSDYKVSTIKYLVYFVKTTSVKEVDRPEIPPNVHSITSFADIISGVAKPDTLVDVVGVIAEVIERKTVNPVYRVTVKLRDNSHVEIIMTVWEEYALQLDDTIEKNHFVQKPLVVMLTLAKIKEPKDKYPLSVQNIKHGSKLYVNGDIVEIQQFHDSLRVPFYIGGLDDEGDVSQSQSTQYCQNKFLHNAQIVQPAVRARTMLLTLFQAEYDPGNTALVTPAKRMSDQQGSSQFDSDEFATYELSTNKHIKAE